MTTTTPETVEERAARLGMAIWLSILPHADNLQPRHKRRPGDVPAEARLEQVTEASQLRAGDIILALDNNEHSLENSRAIGYNTVREAVSQRESAVRRVLSVGKVMVKTEPLIHIPTGGWASCDPDKIGESKFDDTSENINVSAVRWSVARLGHLDDITAAFRAHPDFDAWHEAYRAAQAEQDAANEENRARRAARDAKRAPLLAAVERFNTITGEILVSFTSPFGLDPDEVGEVQFPVKWFAEGDRLTTYLVGLLANGKINNAQYIEALGHLRTLGLYAAELPADIPTTAQQ